jgi:hypothetical protein
MMMINYILKCRRGHKGEGDEGARLYEMRSSGIMSEDISRKFIIEEENESLKMKMMKIPSNLKRGEQAWVGRDTLLFQNNIIGHIYIKTLPGIHSFIHSFIHLINNKLIN